MSHKDYYYYFKVKQHISKFYWELEEDKFYCFRILENFEFIEEPFYYIDFDNTQIVFHFIEKKGLFEIKMRIDYLIDDKELVEAVYFKYNFIYRHQNYLRYENEHYYHHTDIGLRKGNAHIHYGKKTPVKAPKPFILFSEFIEMCLKYIK